MSHYTTFLRSNHAKVASININTLSSKDENDENSAIQRSLLKHTSKTHRASMIPKVRKETLRGILGEVGNMTLSNKARMVESNIVQQQQSSCGVNIESQSNICIPPPAPPPPVSTRSMTTNIIVDETEDIIFEDQFESEADIAAEFDCDSGDLHNITTAAELVVDICKYWKELEQLTPIRQNFLLFRREGTASPQNRAVLIDWLYQVHDRFKLLSDTFHMTIHLIDRYLQAVDVSKHELQLIGSTALLLACKYEEMAIPGMNDFVYVSDNAYSKEDMKEMERRMISTLSFELGRPLSINYLRRYSKLVQATDIEHTLGKYLLDLTFIDHSFSHMLPSYISACASFLSRYLLAYRRITSSSSIKSLVEHMWPRKFMLYHTGYTYEHLRQGIDHLGKLLMDQETAKLRSVQKKFSQSCLFSIAQHSCCKSAYIQVALSHLSQ